MNRIRTMVLGGAAAAALSTLALAGPAAAAPSAATEAPQIDQVALADYWTEWGVPTATQEALLDGIDAGTLPLSVSGASAPVESDTIEGADGTVTIATYADGSITTAETELVAQWVAEDGAVSPMAIENCEVSSGSGYQNNSNCDVTGTNGIVTLGFVASYTLGQGGYDQITSYHTPIVICAPGTCSEPTFTQVVLEESIQGNAGITLTTVYSAADFGSITNILNFEVGGDSASTSFSPSTIE